jgi:DNA-binding CsgD family transcriptional regulator
VDFGLLTPISPRSEQIVETFVVTICEITRRTVRFVSADRYAHLMRINDATDATVRNDMQEHMLNGKQCRAVDLLAEGSSDREVAEALKCDASTVWRWRTANPIFRAALNARRQEVWEGSLDHARSLVPRALDVVEQALDAGDRQAALALLKLAGLGAVDLSRIGPVDPDVIATAEERERVRREREHAEAEVRAAEQEATTDLRRRVLGIA